MTTSTLPIPELAMTEQEHLLRRLNLTVQGKDPGVPLYVPIRQAEQALHRRRQEAARKAAATRKKNARDRAVAGV